MRAADPTPRASSDALDELELDAWRGMLAVHSAMLSGLDAELEQEHGLPLTSYEVLLHLADADGGSLRMGELADRLFLSRSGLTRLIDRLVKAGLVERAVCESDRRGFFATLTPEGKRAFAEAQPTHLRGIREHFLSKLSDADKTALGDAWVKLGYVAERGCTASVED
jgi:DNA-binding MarR family transcriptional regulator